VKLTQRDSEKTPAAIESRPWAIRFSAGDAEALAALRLQPGISVHEINKVIWARGDGLDDAIDRALRKLPGERFWVVELESFNAHSSPSALFAPNAFSSPSPRLRRERLIRPAERIPCGYMPSGTWTPISHWMSPALQPSALPGTTAAKIALRWEVSSKLKEPSALIASAATLRNWTIRATEIRLRPLRFALLADSQSNARAIVHGHPLPPIPGTRLVESDGIAWPAGLAPNPAVDPPVLRELLQLRDGDIAVFNQDGTYAWIAAESFVPLSRSAVRSSLPDGISFPAGIA
jgi:hypothetical protein